MRRSGVTHLTRHPERVEGARLAAHRLSALLNQHTVRRAAHGFLALLGAAAALTLRSGSPATLAKAGSCATCAPARLLQPPANAEAASRVEPPGKLDSARRIPGFDTQWQLFCLVHNIGKIHRNRKPGRAKRNVH